MRNEQVRRSWEVSDRKFKCGEPNRGGRAESRGGQHCEPNNANYTLEVKLERLQFH